MRKNYFQLGATLAAALALAGCGGGGGGGGGAALPTADNILPSEVPTGSTARIGDYLVPGSGTWRINLDGQVQTTMFGSAALADAMIYDPVADEWTINVRGNNLTMSDDGFGGYLSACDATATSCAGFVAYDDDLDPATSQYGTFGYVAYADAARLVEYFVHAGLKTQQTDMPVSGSGAYAGTFLGLVNADIGFDYVEGTADVIANFASSSVTFDSTGVGLDGTYVLAGDATISGNTYSGTVSGSYTNSVGTTTFNTSGSTLSGAFYGPVLDETAGVVYSSGATGEIAGGFWAQQTP